MADNEIGEAWKQYFPKWQRDVEANLICRLICRVIFARARHEIKPLGRYSSDRLKRILRECGIKETEFSEVVAKDSHLNELFRTFQGIDFKKKRAVKKTKRRVKG